MQSRVEYSLRQVIDEVKFFFFFLIMELAVDWVPMAFHGSGNERSGSEIFK